MKKLFVHLPNFNMYFFDQMIEGIQNCVLHHHDWEINQLHNYQFISTENKTNINKDCLHAQAYDALITYAHHLTDYDVLSSIQCPIVILEPDALHKDYLIIRTDFNTALDTGIQHLHNCGYKEIGLITQQDHGPRKRAFFEKMFCQKCEFKGMIPKLLNYSCFEQEFTDWMQQTKQKTAFVVGDARFAKFANQQAKLHGKSIPQDFGILALTVHYLTHPEFEEFNTLGFDSFHLGFKAAETAIAWAESSNRPKHIGPISCHRLDIGSHVEQHTNLHPEVAAAIEYIDENFLKDITLKDIFDQGKVSRKTLERHFKAALNCSPNDYLINKKLDNVKTLLIQTSLPIGNIATNSGFSNVAYMTRLFKKQFNATPREYRKSHRM